MINLAIQTVFVITVEDIVGLVFLGLLLLLGIAIGILKLFGKL